MLLLLSGCQGQQEMRVSPNSDHDSLRVWNDESPAFSRCSCDSATYCLTDEDVMIIHMIYASNKKDYKRFND
jgi:hypothetical protein